MLASEHELHRHRCEVRQVIRWRSDPEKGEEWVRNWLKDSKVRGRRRALVEDIKDQLDKGNSGAHGEWR